MPISRRAILKNLALGIPALQLNPASVFNTHKAHAELPGIDKGPFDATGASRCRTTCLVCIKKQVQSTPMVIKYNEGLKITLPAQKPGDYAFTFKISGKDIT